MRSGVPLYYANGAKINLPRSYNNAPDWSFYDLQQSNLFVAMDHQFDNGWTGKMELSHTQYEQNAVSYYQYGEIDPATGLGSSITAAKWVQPSRTSAFDGYLTGPFSLFGREHELVTQAIGTALVQQQMIGSSRQHVLEQLLEGDYPVSYTHLTLPTKA